MKKVVATCIYSEHWEDGPRVFQCWNFTVNHNGNNITLVEYQFGAKPYEYRKFNDLYKSLLNILKNNGYYTQVSSEFGLDFYNIQFIKLGTATISKYGYTREEK